MNQSIHTTDNVIDFTSDISKTGWKLGDDITKLTKSGNVPSWTTVRQRYCKNEALVNPTSYSSEDITRMTRGLAPIVDGAPMELHHYLGRNGDNFFKFIPLTKAQHNFIHYGI